MKRTEIVYINIDELKLNSRNPRLNDKAVDSVAQSIEKYGFKNPLIISGDKVVFCGNTRLKAARKLGLKQAPCIIADDLSEQEIREYAIVDNKTNEIAEWDDKLLMEELNELSLDDFDFDWDIPTIEQEIIEDDPPEVNNEITPLTQFGDIWQLGEHRLMCGDSTDALNINILMDGKKADLVFADPPYGMKKEKDGVANDNLNFDDLLEFNKEWIPLTFDALKDNGSWYCWGIDEPLMDIYSEILKPMIRENKITFRNLITWDKGDAGAGGVSFMGKDGLRSYPISDEKCLFVMCGVQGFNNNKDHYDETFEAIRSYLENEAKRVGLTSKILTQITGVQMFSHWFTKSQFTIIPKTHYKKLQTYYNGKAFDMDYDKLQTLFNAEEHKTLKAAIMAKRAYFDNTHDKMKSVWEFGRVKGEERETAGGHATPKPIALCSREIKSSSREGEIVLDVFGGSGSTLIACEQLNRKAYLMELEPKWCDVIVKRWETLTGKKAVKIN